MPKKLQEEPVEWLSDKIAWDQRNDPEFTYKSVDFYDSFRFKNIIASVGDYVLVSNADSAEPDSEEGCDAAQILKLYQSHDPDLEDRYRARVQWFSRPTDLSPGQWSNVDNIVFHEREVIEDHRPFDVDVSIETFFKKCNIIRGSTSLDVPEILVQNDSHMLTFVCRYRLTPITKKKFSILPVLIEERIALELLRTPASKKNTPKSKTPSSITRRLSRISISEQKNWSIAKNDGMKVMLKRAILTDNMNKEKEIIKKTPQKDERKRPPLKKILLDDEISNILSMELDEKSDDEIPTLIIREREPATPKKSEPMRTPKKPEPLRERKNSILPPGNHIATPKRKASISTPVSKVTESTENVIDSSSKRATRSTRKSIHYEESPIKTPKKEATPRTANRSVRKRLMNDSDEEFAPEPKTPSKRASVSTPSRRTTNTPKRTPRKLANELTPSLKTRVHAIEENEDWNKENTELPGRETQMEEILSFVRNKLLDKESGCMYISGVPGTGKTATVCVALRRLQEETGLPTFQLVEINGMKIAEPRQAYVQIYKQLTGKTLAWEQASSLLEKRFNQQGPRRAPTVLLVDELDALCTRRQDVVYSLMEWATRREARLCVLAVANTMDLPERALAARVASRLGLTRLTFPPYTHTQLQRIVEIRLRSADVSADAVQLIARKVAAVSGDARRALALCSRALELGRAAGRGAGLREVERALAEAASGAAVRAVRCLAPAERLILRAVATEVERTGSDETTLTRALETASALVALEGRPYKCARSVRPPTISQALAICTSLASSRLLLLENNAAEPRLLLNISADDVHYAMKQIRV